MITLSERLRTVASAVPFGTRFVDIGTDHALLPIYLFERHQISFAIATDIAPGPCEAARSNVNRYGMEANISVRMGNGLESVQPGEVDTIAIAGMGGHTAREILEGSPDVLRPVSRIIVQPMNAPYHVRQFFVHNGYHLVNEHGIVEDGRYYEVIVADSTQSHASKDPAYAPFERDPVWYTLAMELGPTQLVRPTDTFVKHVQDTMGSWTYVLTEMSKSTTEHSRLRVQELEEKMDRLSRWMNQRHDEK